MLQMGHLGLDKNGNLSRCVLPFRLIPFEAQRFFCFVLFLGFSVILAGLVFCFVVKADFELLILLPLLFGAKGITGLHHYTSRAPSPVLQSCSHIVNAHQ